MMKNNIYAIIFGLAIISAAALLGNAFKNRNSKAGMIAVTGLGKADFTSDLIVWEGSYSAINANLQAAYAWGNRQLRRPGYPAGAGDPPAHIHYDLWIGPSPMHPYSPEYFKGRPGANCLQWNMYWDFGTGQIGPPRIERRHDAFSMERLAVLVFEEDGVRDMGLRCLLAGFPGSRPEEGSPQEEDAGSCL